VTLKTLLTVTCSIRMRNIRGQKIENRLQSVALLLVRYTINRETRIRPQIIKLEVNIRKIICRDKCIQISSMSLMITDPLIVAYISKTYRRMKSPSYPKLASTRDNSREAEITLLISL
jgi:hypothetical protein